MSAKHPIISITGSSGAGTTSVKRIFEQIFRREKIEAAFIEGDAFHRYDRAGMRAKVAEEEKNGNPNFTHFSADANELDESALWAAQQAAKMSGATPIDADMPDQSQEVGGEIEDEDMEGAEGGEIAASSSNGKAAKGRRRENGDAGLAESGNGGAAVRPAAAAGGGGS